MRTLEQHLPAHMLNILDLESLEISQSSYTDQRLREISSDMLYQLKTRDEKDCYIYALIEHQSSPDKNMMLRFLKYSCNILEDQQRQHQGKLPIIMPLLVYNGVQSPYPYSMDLLNYFQDRKLVERITGALQEYTSVFKNISTDATSRELKLDVDQKLLIKTGDKRKAMYQCK